MTREEFVAWAVANRPDLRTPKLIERCLDMSFIFWRESELVTNGSGGAQLGSMMALLDFTFRETVELLATTKQEIEAH